MYKKKSKSTIFLSLNIEEQSKRESWLRLRKLLFYMNSHHRICVSLLGILHLLYEQLGAELFFSLVYHCVFMHMEHASQFTILINRLGAFYDLAHYFEFWYNLLNSFYFWIIYKGKSSSKAVMTFDLACPTSNRHNNT